MNFEKVKFNNGSIYDLTAGGLVNTEDSLKIILLPGNKTLSQIDSETDNSINTERIEVLDSFGEVMDIKKGYIYQSSCEKKNDYIIGQEEYQDKTNIDGKPIKSYRDISGTVVIVTLKKSDMRKELSNLKEAVELMLVASLEG